MSDIRRSKYSYERKLRQKLKRKGKKESWDNIRYKYQKLGPIKFVEDLELTIKGVRIVFSDDQKEFLNDLWKGGVRFAIVMAGRGSGKTLCLAIYVLWRIVCFDNWDITAMGGSSMQSEKIQWFIEEWKRTNPFIGKSIIKSTHAMGKGKIQSRAYNEVTFHSCSDTSVRGAHTKELMLDEVCSGEAAGNEKSVKASFYDVSTSEDIHLVMTSTSHFLFGIFLDVWNNHEKYGFKRYQWSIAKHESGVKDPYLIYKFKDGWSSNCGWIKDEAIEYLRRNSSDEEWLVEALGGVATMSGVVINPEDLEVAVCKECDDECKPYEFPQCKLLKKTDYERVTERRLGIDWGDIAPNAYTVVGRFKEHVYILFNDERVGLRDTEALDLAESIIKDWKVEITLPDPSQYPMNNSLGDRGVSVHKIFTKYGGQAKDMYVRNAKRHFERGIIHIPKRYEKLINSVKQLSYDKKGRIRKINDHSWDSMIYAMSEYYIDLQKIYSIKKRFVDLW